MIGLTGNKVAIVPIRDSNRTKAGLYIPDEAMDRTDQGIVKYVGPRVQSLKIGMYVIFSGYTGQAVGIEGEGKLLIMPEDFVVAELDNFPSQQIPGLYFIGKDGYTFPAMYENVMELLAEAFERAAWRTEVDENGKKMFDVKTPRPQAHEYEKLRGI